MNRHTGDRGDERTLIDALDRAAEAETSRGITVIDHQGGREHRSWTRIRAYARRTAAALRLEGIEPMDRILLAFPTGFEFLGAFFGAISIGALPIPCPPPDRWRPSPEGRNRPLAHVGERMEARAMLVDPEVDHDQRPSTGPMRPWSLVTDLPALLEDVPVGVSIDEEFDRPDTAYIQLTEGTTGPPRGVLLTHRNMLANVSAIGRRLEVDESDVGVSWIPLHNPLGLIGVVCFGVVFDIELVLLDPVRFLDQPESWLHAISRHGGTLSTAPNFAYDYAVRRCRESELEGLDLSSWRIAMSGGEPVRAQHLEAFARRFGEYGLRDDIFTPVYGLSEATLGVSFGSVDAPFDVDAINRRTLETEARAEPLPERGAPDPAERMHLVSIGTPLDGIECRIVDENGVSLEERRLGEVALRGPNVMRGYVGEDSDSPERERTRIESGWLHTGDLGYLADGELYVVGRAYDRIAWRDGRHLVPEEVELFVDAVDGVYAGRTAAFGVEADDETEASREQLVIAFELQSGAEREPVERSMRHLLDRHLDVEPDALVALSPRSIPRTKSGKVQRSLARALYLRNMLDRRERHGRWGTLRRTWQLLRTQAETAGSRLREQFQSWLDT